jgi:hypothetical protein
VRILVPYQTHSEKLHRCIQIHKPPVQTRLYRGHHIPRSRDHGSCLKLWRGYREFIRSLERFDLFCKYATLRLLRMHLLASTIASRRAISKGIGAGPKRVGRCIVQRKTVAICSEVQGLVRLEVPHTISLAGHSLEHGGVCIVLSHITICRSSHSTNLTSDRARPIMEGHRSPGCSVWPGSIPLYSSPQH